MRIRDAEFIPAGLYGREAMRGGRVMGSRGEPERRCHRTKSCARPSGTGAKWADFGFQTKGKA